MTFKGYGRPGKAGRLLVTVDRGAGEEVLGLPELSKNEGRHSPAGFQWGYAGSGPAELARAILIEVFPGDRRVRHPRVYQRFKFDVVARLDKQGFTMTADEIRAWRERAEAAEPFTLLEWEPEPEEDKSDA